MQKIKWLTLLLLATVSFNVNSQTSGVNYQAIARDADGKELSNANIGIRITIHKTTATGSIDWEETHSLTTDTFGLFHLTIGTGTSTGAGSQSQFSDIDWGADAYFVEVSMDPSGGSSYVSMGTEEIVFVPKSMVAYKAGHAVHSDTASYSANANQSDYADTASYSWAGAWSDSTNFAWASNNSSNADSANHADLSDTAMFSWNANAAINADTAAFADTATQAGQAGHADTSAYASMAGQSNNADTSQFAQVADSARTDGDWAINGSDINFALGGKVGVNQPAPVSSLDVYGSLGTKAIYVDALLYPSGYNVQDEVVITIDPSPGNLTLFLPDVTTVKNRVYLFKLTQGGTNNVVINSGSAKIDGETNYTICDQYNYVEIISDGTTWFIIGEQGANRNACSCGGC